MLEELLSVLLAVPFLVSIFCNRNVRLIFGGLSTIGLGGVLDDEEVEVEDLLIAAVGVFWGSTRAAAVCRGTEASREIAGPKHAGTVRGVLDASALPEFWAKIPVAWWLSWDTDGGEG